MTATRDSEDYERLVSSILEERIRKEYPNAVLKVFQNRKYKGQSGHEHQIDISVEMELVGCQVLIVGECKKYRERVGNEDILVLAGRMQDIGAHKGILVTTSGFQEGAKRVAKAKGIALVLVHSDDPISWEVLMPAVIPLLLIAGAELLKSVSADQSLRGGALEADANRGNLSTKIRAGSLKRNTKSLMESRISGNKENQMLASKAVIFTHMPVLMDGQPHAYTSKMANRLKRRILHYLKAYLSCRNIGLVYVYVDTGVRLTLQHLSDQADTLQFPIGELEFEQNTRNCLKLAVDKAISDLSREANSSFSLPSAPKIQFIGLPHLLTLIHSLYRIDTNLLRDLAGREQRFTYDSPKFVEAAIRLVRGSHPVHGLYPIFRIDEDVEVNEAAIGLLLEEARDVMQNPTDPYSFFSGGYGNTQGPHDAVNDYAIRLHWLVDRDTHELGGRAMCFVRDLGEFGATQVSTDQPISAVMSDFLRRERGEYSANRDLQQAISGAGLFMSRLAIRMLPPFMNFHTPITWIDDHLKRRLHEVLGHIDPDDPDNTEHIDNALFKQNRHPKGISVDDVEKTKDWYFERLLSGCILHRLITSPEGDKGELAEKVDSVLSHGHKLTFDEEDLRKKLEKDATDAALSVLNVWEHADYGSAMLSHWAAGMSRRIVSWLFFVGDLKDPKLLAIKLRDAKDSSSQYIREQFSAEMLDQLGAYDGSNSPSESLQSSLVEGLNQLLEGTDLRETAGFADLQLTKQFKRLIEQAARSEDRIRLNRLLLERAYPLELAGTLISSIVNDAISYVHLVSRWPQYIDAIAQLTPIHAYWLFRNVEVNP